MDDDIKSYKISFRTQLFIVKEHLPFIMYGVIGTLVVMHFDPRLGIIMAKAGSVGYSIVAILPNILVHIQYLRINKDVILSVSMAARSMEITRLKETRPFSFDEILSVRLALMPDIYNGADRGLLPLAIYHYAYIELKDNEHFVITCLMVNNLGKFFEGLGIEVRKDCIHFPMVLMSRYAQKTLVKEKNINGW